MNEPTIPPAETSPEALSQDRILISWHAPEFIDHPRGPWWFAIAGLLTLGAVLYSLYTSSVTTALVFLLLAGVYFLTHNQAPRIIDIKVTELGIRVHETFYPYNTIRSFWLVYRPPFVQTLNLQTTKKTFPRLVIQLNGQDPIPLHDVLSKKIPEVEGAEEGFVEATTRIFRL